MRFALRSIDSAVRPTRTNGPDRRPSRPMATAYTSSGAPSRSDTNQRNFPSGDHAGLLFWNSFPVSSTRVPPAEGKRTIALGASFPNSGPGCNSTKFPATQAIHVLTGDHTHECNWRPLAMPTARQPEPGNGRAMRESLRTIAIESPFGDHDAERTWPSPG